MSRKPQSGPQQPGLDAFWSRPSSEVLDLVGSSPKGLSAGEASKRLETYGPNTLATRRKTTTLRLLLTQFKSPIILILIFAAILSIFLGDRTDSIIILSIVAISGLLGFWQERGANNAVAKLLAIVQIEARVMRNGKPVDVHVEEVVPGDVVMLDAGDIIPGDCLLLEANDLFADEATLTGETYPAEKEPGVLAADAALAKRTNVLFMGTHVVSGSATALVVRTGKTTEFGQVSQSLRTRPAENEFEKGVKHFGYLLLEVTLTMVIAIFGINVYLHRPVVDSFLFSLALAVGLTPQLLPAIISINLAHGARRMAAKKVIVKRLVSIENLGSMNVFCSDKTGTLTEGVVQLDSTLDCEGEASTRVLRLAYINAKFETGFTNPLDQAIRDSVKSHKPAHDPDLNLTGVRKLDEVPYDFLRKRLSVLVKDASGQRTLVTKGTFASILEVCTKAAKADGTLVPLSKLRPAIKRRYTKLSTEGYRVLGVAYREDPLPDKVNKDEEHDLIFAGFLVFFDPPKKGVIDTIAELHALGVELKIITGDNPLVAANVGNQVGLSTTVILTGKDLHKLSEEALMRQVSKVQIFAEIEPNQKEQIILALRKAGHVVGYMGDGINDASALHAADVGISVNSAVDVAKEAADFVLLEKDLGVLGEGIREGRKTFANTLKYVFMATSANFGNMFSMAGASLFLKFLPLLPGQILMTNLLTDFPEMTIATDGVDPEILAVPRRWDIRFIRRFMLVFGTLSSVFDYATFGVLLLVLHAKEKEFRTGWFVESVVSAALIVLVVRTRRPVIHSRPSRPLLIMTLVVAAVAVAIPFTPLSGPLGFVRLPLVFWPVLAGIVILYIASAEAAKRVFYSRERSLEGLAPGVRYRRQVR